MIDRLKTLKTGMGGVLAIAGCALVVAVGSAVSMAAEANFERVLRVSGRVELSVATGSGYIHIHRGSAGAVRVVGHVRPGWGQTDDKAREVAANPPVQQTGNIIRIGFQHNAPRNLSIDYDVEAPEGAILDAATGSGDIADEGVGQGVKLSTGSGAIRATGVHGDARLETGSGNISLDQSGAGDVKAEAGSGSIDLHHLQGALKAETGSGSIRAEGTPQTGWKLETGSGSVEVWTGGASFNLDAESGSGHIQSDRPLSGGSAEGHHHLTGSVGGGGPLVRIGTGSGSIHVH